jgi:NAD+ diphosphatase
LISGKLLNELLWDLLRAQQLTPHTPVTTILFDGYQVALNKDKKLPHSTYAERLLPESVSYAGHDSSTTYLAGNIASDALPPELVWHSLRGLIFDDEVTFLDELNALRQRLTWRDHHRFCGRCGAQTRLLANEVAVSCVECSTNFYANPAPSIIVRVVKGDQILLAHNARFPPNRYSLLAGFCELGEPAEQSVHREVKEEVGIAIKNIRYVTSQSWPMHNALMLGFEAEYDSGDICPDGKEILKAQWFDRDHLPDLPGAGTIAYRLIEQWKQALDSGN